MNPGHSSRRLLLKRAATLGLLAAVERLVPAYASASAAVSDSQIALRGDVIDLTIGEQLFRPDGRTGSGGQTMGEKRVAGENSREKRS